MEATISSGTLEYSATDTTTYPYSRSYFYTNAGITGGVVSNTDLYLLKGASSTQTTFNILKDGLSLETGILRVKRYDTATGNYNLVAMSYISGGSTSVDLQHTDAVYKFEVYTSGSLLCTVPDVTSGGMVISGTTTLNCYTAGQTTTWWDSYVQLRDANYTINFNNATNVSSLTYSIPSGLASTNCFRVVKWENMLNSEAYYTCQTSASGTLQYLITDLDANYNLQYVTQLSDSNVFQVVGSEWITLKQYLYDKIGNDSVLYALVIVLMMGLLGLSISAAASVGLTMTGLLVVWYFGILNIGIAALVGMLVVGGVLISRLNR